MRLAKSYKPESIALASINGFMLEPGSYISIIARFLIESGFKENVSLLSYEG